MKLVFVLTSVIILITSEAAKHHSAYRYQDRGCAPECICDPSIPPDSEFQHLRRLLAVHGEEAPINQSSLLDGEEAAKIESSSKTLVHGCWDLLITQLLAQFNSGMVAGDFLPGGDLGGYCCNFPYGVCQAETNDLGSCPPTQTANATIQFENLLSLGQKMARFLNRDTVKKYVVMISLLMVFLSMLNNVM